MKTSGLKVDLEDVDQRGEVTCSESLSKGSQDGFLTVTRLMGACSLRSEPSLCRGLEGTQDSARSFVPELSSAPT